MEEFTQDLIQLKAYKKERETLANRVIAQPEYLGFLLNTCFQVDENISYKAAWVLELVCTKRPELLFPQIDFFISNLPNVHKEQAVRPMAKICEVLLLLYYKSFHLPTRTVLTCSHREQLTETCFDWLISNQKVAVKAYAMQCLFLLGYEFTWIHPELKLILEKDFPNALPAFKSRAKHILKKLH